MTANRVKMFAGNGPVNLEKMINGWFAGEGENAQVRGMNTSVSDVVDSDSKATQKIIVTIWYSQDSN